MRQLAIAFLVGVAFAVGLGISGMTNPYKVIDFLDVAGPWDPSLALVMAGAIATHVGAAQWALRAKRPLWSERFAPSGAGGIDASLVFGSALFGLGWGIAGFCPGPALVDLVAPSRSVLTFVAAMVAGMVGFRVTLRSRRRAQLEGARRASARLCP
jgi:uncharacterized membrane protein YedE/YeeE